MIVKTGANYQAEGGYIEFATGDNSYVMIDDKKIPANILKGSYGITSVINIKVKKTVDASGAIRVLHYVPQTTNKGDVLVTSSTGELLTNSYREFTMVAGLGAQITTPTNTIPLLEEGSHNVEILQLYAGTDVVGYTIAVTGEDPIAVLSYTEA